MPRVLIYLIASTAISLIATPANAADIWTKDQNGWARHAASGLGCPPTLATRREGGAASLTLVNVVVGSDRQPAGDLVGCDYEGEQGAWASVEVKRLRANETVAAQAAATQGRIQARLPGAKRALKKISSHPVEGDRFMPLPSRKPENPTGGDTFTSVFEVEDSNRKATVAVAGGDVRGWMLTLVQFDHGGDATDLQAATVTNWEMLVRARLAGQRGL